jgi:hypothetical protein
MSVYSILVLLPVQLCIIAGCTKEPVVKTCVHGTIIGQGCLTGSYAIELDKKNREYGIRENLAYDNVVETQNLPDQFKNIGTKVCFTFTTPTEEIGKYLTYCTPAPQISMVEISLTTSPVAIDSAR